MVLLFHFLLACFSLIQNLFTHYRFLKPKTLLCSHFWSIQQRLEFSTQDLTERLKHNKPVFRALQARIHNVPEGDLKRRMQRVLAQLGSGVHPKPEDVLACKELFTKVPYHLDSLSYHHLVSILIFFLFCLIIQFLFEKST